MKDKKKNKREESNNANDPRRKSTLVIESNPDGAQYDENKGTNGEGPPNKLVDGDKVNDGR